MRREQMYRSAERGLQWPMLLLSVALIPVLLISLIDTHLDSAWQAGLDAADYTIWAAFAVEYAVLFTLAPSRWRFFLTHIPELLLILLPMLRALGLARAAVLLRVAQAARLAFVAWKIARIRKVSVPTRAALIPAAAAGVLITLCATMVWSFEHGQPGGNIKNVGVALWWAVVTITTVGYGDHFPVTAAGRAMGVVLMLLGIGLLSVVTASIAAWLIRLTQGGDDEEKPRLEDELSRLREEITILRTQLDATFPRQMSDGHDRAIGRAGEPTTT